MLNIIKVITLMITFSQPLAICQGKELALSFDDAPVADSFHFRSIERTKLLVTKLHHLQIPAAIIFANPCRRPDTARVLDQLKLYTDAGHLIGNHTCSHPRLDDVGILPFTQDLLQADVLLQSFLQREKFFRFPFLNEGTNLMIRNQARDYLQQQGYRNGFVSLDTDDYLFSFQINQAKKMGHHIDYQQVERLFLQHLIDTINFYDNLAVKVLHRSPKHILLLHEMDATVMFLESLITKLRQEGWKIISPSEAYKDPIYSDAPKNTYANNGIIAQWALELTGEKFWYPDYEKIQSELNEILDLQ